MKMKVGVDARSLTRSLTGIGRYTFEMCRVLSENPNICLILYSHVPLINECTGLKNVVMRTPKKHTYSFRLRSQLWLETTLPFLINKDKPDIFWGPAHFLPRFLSKSIPSIVTIHDLVWKYAKETMRPTNYFIERIRMPYAIRRADQIVTVSNATAIDIEKEFSVPKEKIHAIWHGVSQFGNLNTKAIQTDDASNLNEKYILFVGTLEPRKNLKRLLEAYALLPESLKNEVKLVIAGGEGWGNINLQNLIHSLQLKNFVKLTGYVDNNVLSNLYANAYSLVMPSLYEGFGLPLIEAMSYGVPVLTSNTSSMPEITLNGGVLVDPLNVRSIYSSLKQLLENSELHKSLSDAAKIRSKNFTWNIAGEKLLHVFQNSLTNSPYNIQNKQQCC